MILFVGFLFLGSLKHSGPLFKTILLVVFGKFNLSELGTFIVEGCALGTILSDCGWELVVCGLEVNLIVVVVRVDGMCLILLPGLGFTSIAFFSEGVVQILTVVTNPITLPMNRF